MSRSWRSAVISPTPSSAASPDRRVTRRSTTITTSTVGRGRRIVKLLADTSALLALVLRDDGCHAAAAGFVRENPRARFVLTELILGEVATRIRARSSAERAARVAGDLLRSRRFELVILDSDLI